MSCVGVMRTIALRKSRKALVDWLVTEHLHLQSACLELISPFLLLPGHRQSTYKMLSWDSDSNFLRKTFNCNRKSYRWRLRLRGGAKAYVAETRRARKTILGSMFTFTDNSQSIVDRLELGCEHLRVGSFKMIVPQTSTYELPLRVKKEHCLSPHVLAKAV